MLATVPECVLYLGLAIAALKLCISVVALLSPYYEVLTAALCR